MKDFVTSNSSVAEPDEPATATRSARLRVESALGQTIGLARAKVGLSIAALAASIEMPIERLESIEVGAVRPSAEEIYRISLGLNYPISYFFTLN